MYAAVSWSCLTVNLDPDVVLHVYGFNYSWLCIPCVIHAELSDLSPSWNERIKVAKVSIRTNILKKTKRPRMKWKMRKCRTFFNLIGSKDVAEKFQLSNQYVRYFALGSSVVNLLEQTLVSDHKKIHAFLVSKFAEKLLSKKTNSR